MPDSEEQIPKKHGLLSPIDFSEINDEEPNKQAQKAEVEKYFRSKNFTPEVYRELLSGQYHDHFNDSDLEALAGMLKRHKLNNTENNDAAVRHVLDEIVAGKKDQFWQKYKLRGLMHNFPLSSDALHNVINNYEKVGKENLDELQKNPSFNREHLAAIVNKPTVAMSSEMMKHPAMDQELFDRMMRNRKYDTNKLPGTYYEHPLFNAEHAGEVLRNPKSKMGEHEFDKVLEKLSPEARHSYLNDALGITGGKPAADQEDFDRPDEYGWDNWENGEKHLPRMAQAAAESKYLTPDQIEHIKRHGDFDQKFALFNNANIDPKHALEMLSLWDQDAHRKGYDEDDLKKKFREEHEDNLWDDYREEAEQEVQEDNPLSDYLKNFSDDELSQAYFDKDYSDWKKEWLRENKGEEAVPNPNFMSDEPETDYNGHNPKTVKLKDLDDSELEDLPEYDGDLEDKSQEAFKSAMDNEQTPDSIYEGYDESNSDAVYQRMNEMFADELKNWSSSDKFLPRHVSEAVKAPWADEENITPEQLKQGLDHPLKMVRDTAAANENMTPELISHVLGGDYDDDMKKAVLSNTKNLRPEHIKQAIESGDVDLAKKALSNPKATPEHIQLALEKFPDDDSVAQKALDHAAAPNEMAQAIVNKAVEKGDYQAGLRAALEPHFNISPESLLGVMQKVPNAQSQEAAVRHPNATAEVINHALNSDATHIRKAAHHVQQRRFPPTADPVNVKLGTHPLRILRDFLDQNGGTMSKSKMKSMGVNTAPIDKLFSPKGTISSKDIQGYIDQMPGTGYNTSHSDWEGGQRHSDEKQGVFQLNYTQDQVAQMEKEGVLPTFQKIHEATFRSGHPVRPNTLGWVRYTGNPETGFHIDEVQTDFGQSMIKKVAEQAKEALRTGAISEEQAEDAMKRAKDYYPEEHVQKITNILFGNRHPSEVLHEAFKEYMRQKGFGNTPVHIWQPQSKAPISGQMTQIQIKDKGKAKELMEDAKKGNLDHGARALIAWGQKSKLAPASFKELKPEHLDAIGDAYEKYLSGIQDQNEAAYIQHVEDRKKDPHLELKQIEVPSLPVPLPVHMQEGYGNIPKKMKYSEGTYGELPTQSNPEHKGNPTYKEAIRKSEVDASTRTKVAMTLKAIKDNAETWNQLKESNPQAYEAIHKLVQSLISVFKRKTGEDPQALVHELEIQQQIEEQQAQMQQDGGGQPGQPSQPGQPAQDEPIHRRKMVYAPGSIRRYSSQDERIKGQSGEWSSFGGGLQDPSEGKNG